jgi:hypothetical protein
MKNIARNSIEGHEFVIEVAIVHHTNHHTWHQFKDSSMDKVNSCFFHDQKVDHEILITIF